MDPAGPPPKRPRLDQSSASFSQPDAAVVRLQRSVFLSSLSRSVSPPPRPSQTPPLRSSAQISTNTKATTSSSTRDNGEVHQRSTRPIETLKPSSKRRLISSPFQLTRIYGLPHYQNIDTVTIQDLLGDVLIKEAWIFNYLFDVDWVMQQFDPDVRDLISVKIIHGSWKNDSENRTCIEEARLRYSNVETHVAWLSDPFGTHHTKMIILFRHDDLAQVIIHTANMIPKDWKNMTQAVWRSPLLPLLPLGTNTTGGADVADCYQPFGSGLKFKFDLLQYLKAYSKQRTGSLVKALSNYDFSAVKGALIGSVPGKTPLSTVNRMDSDIEHVDAIARPTVKGLWGWRALVATLKAVEAQRQDSYQLESLTMKRTDNADSVPKPVGSGAPHVVLQVSSVATLTNQWLLAFFDAMLIGLKRTTETDVSLQVQKPLAGTSSTLRSNRNLVSAGKRARFSIIFPTPTEVRESLGGYASGSSIHTKTQSSSQKAQVESLRPFLCHWNSTLPARSGSVERAGRKHAAPHIKTYIRFSSTPTIENPAPTIDWALLTSANLSTQAWGSLPTCASKLAESRISSYELGVLIWPELFADQREEEDVGKKQMTAMVPVFGKDTPDLSSISGHTAATATNEEGEDILVGLRMPYDLPLIPYGPGEMPWCASMSYDEADRHGHVWSPAPQRDR